MALFGGTLIGNHNSLYSRQPLKQLSIPIRTSEDSGMNRSVSASQIEYQQHPNAPFSGAEKQASGCKPHQVTSMEFASLIRNSEMPCIFDIVEHPPISPTHCDGCGAKFYIVNGLECKKGGLVIKRHDEIKFELQDLAARALIPCVVRAEPQSNQAVSRMLKRPKECLHQQERPKECHQDFFAPRRIASRESIHHRQKSTTFQTHASSQEQVSLASIHCHLPY